MAKFLRIFTSFFFFLVIVLATFSVSNVSGAISQPVCNANIVKNCCCPASCICCEGKITCKGPNEQC